MKTSIALAVMMGLALIAGIPDKSEAVCLVFCDDSEDDAAVEVGEDAEVSDSSVSAGDGSTTAIKNSNTVVIGGNVTTTQSNYIGGIGTNRGDINQSNSANITGQSNNNTSNNDMRSFRGRNGNDD